MRSQLFTMFLLLFCTWLLSADEIRFAGDSGASVKKSLKVKSITNDQVVTDQGTYPVDQIESIVLDHLTMPLPKSGMVLDDGALLGGTIRERSKGYYTFFSPVFGEFEVRIKQVCCIIYDREIYQPRKQYLGTGKDFGVLAARSLFAPKVKRIDRNLITFVEQKVYFADSKKIKLSSPDGMRTIFTESNQIYLVLFSAIPNPKRWIELRNGDVLTSDLEFYGAGVNAVFGEKKLEKIPLSAISEIHFGTTTKQINKKP